MKRKELIHDLRAIGFLAEAHQVLEYGADQIGETGEPSPSSASPIARTCFDIGERISETLEGLPKSVRTLLNSSPFAYIEANIKGYLAQLEEGVKVKALVNVKA